MKTKIYLLQSMLDKSRTYVGLTGRESVEDRLAEHNRGRSPYTSSFKPWKLLVSMEFTDEKTAINFEAYLKSGSGRAFLQRHFLTKQESAT